MTIFEQDTVNKFTLAKCPCCGEMIMIPRNEKECFCTFCGSKFLSDAAIVYATASSLSGYRPKVEVKSEVGSAQYPMPHMMTIQEVADTGVLPKDAIRRLVKQKRINAVYVGRKALINYEKLIELLESASFDPE